MARKDIPAPRGVAESCVAPSLSRALASLRAPFMDGSDSTNFALALGFCSLLALASSRRASGQYSLRPLLNSRARWFLLSQGAPGATFMPLPVLPVVLLSLSCLVLHGSEGSARREPWGSTSA